MAQYEKCLSLKPEDLNSTGFLNSCRLGTVAHIYNPSTPTVRWVAEQGSPWTCANQLMWYMPWQTTKWMKERGRGTDKGRDCSNHGRRQGYLMLTWEVAKQGKALAAKPQDMNFILRTLWELTPVCCPSSFMRTPWQVGVCVCVCACLCVYNTHTTNKNNE